MLIKAVLKYAFAHLEQLQELHLIKHFLINLLNKPSAKPVVMRYVSVRMKLTDLVITMLLNSLVLGRSFDSLSLIRAFTAHLTCTKLNTFILDLLVFMPYSRLKVCFNKSQLDQRLGREICIDLWSGLEYFF